MHTLRHRAAGRAYRGTRNLRAVQQILGHSSVGTTEFYCAVARFRDSGRDGSGERMIVAVERCEGL